jgi:nucleoside-diphosphate-sugar epimerase
MQTVFITGANGFIGSNLCRYFLKKNFNVHGLVRKTSDLHFLEDLNIKLVYSDLSEVEKTKLPENLDFIIHCASEVSDKADRKSCEMNICGATENFVNHIMNNNIRLKKFIYMSTALVLGYRKLNICEENPGKPASLPYVQSKIKTEKYLLEAHKKNGLPLVILRPADVYGPYDRTSCAPIVKGLEDGLPPIVGKGNWIFPLCYVDNLSLATYLACIAQNIEGNAYTITNDSDVTWKEFFSVILKRINKKQRFYIPKFTPFVVAFFMKTIHFFVPSFEPSLTYYRAKRITSHTTYDISRTIKDLNYSPDKDTEKQFNAIMDWYLAEQKSGYIE